MRALVLSAGGNKCSYQVGALKYLINDLKINYDIFTGVSAGGINAAYLSQFDNAYEQNIVNSLESIWLNIKNENIYKRWLPFGKLHAIFKSSFYNGEPLKELVYKHLDFDLLQNTKKFSTVGATSLTTGEYKLFNNKDKDFISAVIAGASFPIMLSPLKINDEYYTDGGIMQITPIKSAITLGATHLDIIITNPEQSEHIKFNNDNLTVISSLKRILNLCTDQILKLDLEHLKVYNIIAKNNLCSDKKELVINIIRPKNHLTNNILDFNQNKIKNMIEIGYNDAKSQFDLKTLNKNDI